MRVIRDAERTVEPIRLPGNRFSVVQRLGFDLQADSDADRFGEILHELRIFRDVGVLLRRQRHIEAGDEARGRHQLFRLGDILITLWNRGVGRRIQGRERAVVSHRAHAATQAVDQLLAVEAERQGPAHALVGERGQVASHMELAMIGRGHAQDPDVGIRANRGAHDHRDGVEHVDLAGLQSEQARLNVGVELELDAIRQRLRAPIIGIADERRPFPRAVALQPEGSGPHEVALVIAAIIRGQNDRIVVVDGYRVGEIAVRCVEVKSDGVIVDLARAALRQHSFENRQGVRYAARIREPIEARHHILGAHFGAIVKLHAPPQLEGPDAAVAVVRPAFRQHRPQRQIGLRHAEELGDLKYHLVAAAVIHHHGIDGAMRHRDPGSHHAAGRSRGECAARAEPEPLGGGESAQQRQTDTEPAGVPQKHAPIDPPGR